MVSTAELTQTNGRQRVSSLSMRSDYASLSLLSPLLLPVPQWPRHRGGKTIGGKHAYLDITPYVTGKFVKSRVFLTPPPYISAKSVKSPWGRRPTSPEIF
jgi:hypothetical protein